MICQIVSKKFPNYTLPFPLFLFIFIIIPFKLASFNYCSYVISVFCNVFFGTKYPPEIEGFLCCKMLQTFEIENFTDISGNYMPPRWHSDMKLHCTQHFWRCNCNIWRKDMYIQVLNISFTESNHRKFSNCTSSHHF